MLRELRTAKSVARAAREKTKENVFLYARVRGAREVGPNTTHEGLYLSPENRYLSLVMYIPEEFRQRPRDYDPALADLIVERVLNGESLTDICDDRDYPMAGTFLQWVSREPELASAYAEAQKIRTDVLVEKMLTISDDYNTQRAKNQLDARKFHAEKLLPAKYGPRSHTTVHTTDKEDEGGIDYGADVRRKLEAMATRIAAEAPVTEAGAKPD